MIISKRLSFDAAHRLQAHQGKCRFLHGHTYNVEIVCDGAIDPSTGYAIDFGDIERKVGAWIDANWDHATLAAASDAALIEFCERSSGGRVFVFDGPPTAENIAVKLLEVARGLLGGITVAAVRVRETATCCAEAT